MTVETFGIVLKVGIQEMSIHKVYNINCHTHATHIKLCTYSRTLLTLAHSNYTQHDQASAVLISFIITFYGTVSENVYACQVKLMIR